MAVGDRLMTEDDTTPKVTQSFSLRPGTIVRDVRAGKFRSRSVLGVTDQYSGAVEHESLGRIWELLRLRGRTPRTEVCESSPPLRVVDICCGPGGFATGFRRACQAVGVRCTIAAAVDTSSHALAVYRRNLRPRRMVAEHVANLVDYDDEGTSPPVVSSELRALAEGADVVLAGPPCEGNSNLNNRTRRVDRRNELYLACVALAIGMRANVVLVENVVQVTRAKQKVVPRAIRMLTGFGYQIVTDHLVLDAAEYGTAQRRRRHFLVATRSAKRIDLLSVASLKTEPMSVMEAIGDLTDGRSNHSFDRPSQLSAQNQDRVNYLHTRPGRYELPDSERPHCHRNGHTYPSVYGRMRAEQPSQTITTGFLSPGRGRYIHPTMPRGLTLREGARLQGFADDYRWFGRGEDPQRTTLAHLIGDAVPPQLGYVTGLLGLAVLP